MYSFQSPYLSCVVFYRLFLAVSAVPPPVAHPASAQYTNTTAPGVCQSFGIDFKDGGTYFVNSGSNDSFTSITQFKGKNSFHNHEGIQ
jgi:hypothetical protein